MFGFLNNTTITAFDKKGFTLALPETGNQYFYVYTDIVKSQYYGDVVVPVLITVTVKGKHGSHVSRNLERRHYVFINTISQDEYILKLYYNVSNICLYT